MSRYFEQRGIGGFSMFPPVLKFLLIANVAVFVLQNFLLGSLVFQNIPLENYFLRFFALQSLGSEHSIFPWQLITYQFMHSGFMHLFFNMFALWMFGSELEYLWGSKKFAFYYLLCGIGAGIIQILIADVPTIGASGAVYGILLAFGFTFPNRPILMFPIFIPIPAKYYVVIFAAIAFISGMTGADNGVAHFAHVAGAVTGLILLTLGEKIGLFNFLSRIFSGRKRQNAFFEDDATVHKVNWRIRKPAEENNIKAQPSNTNPLRSKVISFEGEEITQAKIDAILDKISASGYQNLTDKEKNILTELSKRL